MSHWRYFRLSEFACKCGCDGHLEHMSSHFISRLDALRETVGFPLVVSSGYRCPDHDAEVGGKGVHPQGKAADFAVRGVNQRVLVRAAFAMKFQGIGAKAHGSGRLVHLDDLPTTALHPRPAFWTYT